MAASRTISDAGVAFIKDHEGLHARAAPLPDGRWVIGYSSVGEEINEADAEVRLRAELVPIEDAIRTLVFAPMTQAQFDALVSLGFSIGVDALRACGVADAMNAGRPIDAADVFDDWVRAHMDGREVRLDALVRRRAAEKAMFLAVDTGPVPASSAVVRAMSAQGHASTPQSKAAHAPSTARANGPDPELIDRLNKILPERAPLPEPRATAEPDPVRMAGAPSQVPSAPFPVREGMFPPAADHTNGRGPGGHSARMQAAYVDPSLIPASWRGRWPWLAGGAGLALAAGGLTQMRSFAAEKTATGPDVAWTAAMIAGVMVVAAAAYLLLGRGTD